MKNEKGMMTVEAVLSLVPFIMVVMGIISFINVFMVHNKVQYAMYQAANELTAYTYFYEALGIRRGDQALGADINRETEEIDNVIKKTSDFLEELETLGPDVIETGRDAVHAGVTLVSDPKDLLRNMVYFGIEQGEHALKSWMIDAVSSTLIPIYLESEFSASNPMTADEYLTRSGVIGGVKGIDFCNSTLFQDDEYKMIDIVAEYDIEISFFELFFNKPVIHIVQRCAVPAWLDGDGIHYREKK